MSKSLCILGSTGSIGKQSLEVARCRGYSVASLSAYSNSTLLEQQAREFKPGMVALYDERAAKDLRIALADTDIKVFSGSDGICECAAEYNSDTVINAIVGLAGLLPTLSAIRSKKTLALANKETLVAGGEVVIGEAKKNGVRILPVDSEHSAIFQCLQGCPPDRRLKRIILTASGGPFFGKSRAELEGVTLEQALKHPNWSMGAKITVDSATMFNKGLELIEAVRLFDVSADMIDIVVHRESIVHSMVEYEDNSVIAQLGLPDMRIPIQYALTWPERFESPVGSLDFSEISKLTFYKPDFDAFDCPLICMEAIKRGGLFPAAVNSANEEANLLFREGKIGFTGIGALIRTAFEVTPATDSFSVEDILAVDALVRAKVRNSL